jgi:hypothetical protein
MMLDDRTPPRRECDPKRISARLRVGHRLDELMAEKRNPPSPVMAALAGFAEATPAECAHSCPPELLA